MVRLNRESAAFHICVEQADAHNAWNISGRVVSQRLSSPMPFQNVNTLLLQLDAVMDAQDFPQAFEQIRTFTASKPISVPAAMGEADMMSAEDVQNASGAVETFTLHIFTRRKTTWQGMIVWQDGSPNQQFESVLDFLKIISSRY